MPALVTDLHFQRSVTVAFPLDSTNIQARVCASSRSTSQESVSGGFAGQLLEATRPDSVKPQRIKGKPQEDKQPRKDGDPTVVVSAMVPMATPPAPFSLDFDPASTAGLTGQPGPETAKLANAEPATVAAVLKPEVVATPSEPVFARQSTKRSEQTDETAPPSSESPGKAPLELAFAARIKPANPVVAPATKTHDPSQSRVLAEAAPAASKRAGVEEEPIARADDPQPLLQNAVATYVHNTDSTPTISVSPPRPEALRAEMPTPKADERPKTVEPLENLSIQLPRSNSDRVEVRLTQQSGEVHVAVRTTDPDLANGLREGLPDLVGRLQESGFRTDTWRPAGGTSPAGPAPETQNASSHTHGNDYQSNSGGSQQHSDQRDQNQSKRPHWVEELESSITMGAN
jgi:hypothetical protein